LLRWRRVKLCAYIIPIAVIFFVGAQLGQEIFPHVDSGQFQLRVRAPAGTRIEQTEEIGLQALEIIKSVVGPENVEMTVGFGGVSPSSYTINTVYVWTGGPEEVLLRVALKHGSGQRIEDVKHKLRAELPERLGAWLRKRLRTLGVAEDRIAERLADLRFSFEPADIVNEVMSFGSPTPVSVSIDSPDIAATRRHAEKVRAQLAHIESLHDLQYVESYNYPTVEVAVDRQRAGKSKVTTDEVARAMVAYTSSSRFVMPNYWVDPKSGTGYQVQVEVPPVQMDSVKEVELVTVKQSGGGHISLRDVARVREGVAPGQVDRYNMRRTVTLTANIEGEDLGRVSRRIDAALKAAGEPPRGVRVSVRGQIVPMRQMFAGLTQGLGLTVVAILILLLAYFQSLRLAIVVVSTVPAVLAGVVLMLFVTRTTLNIQSCMGAIMSIGVAVANAILLVTFAERSRQGGASAVEAALAGARGRLRPILMTSLAMISGMVPLALALGEGGEQTAPLGRAVIGGLLAATLATLFVLPSVFVAMNWLRISSRSVSLHPRDPESPYFVAEEHPPIEPASGGTA
jgi:multidrug efflux pump subunit AcrB